MLYVSRVGLPALIEHEMAFYSVAFNHKHHHRHYQRPPDNGMGHGPASRLRSPSRRALCMLPKIHQHEFQCRLSAADST